MGVLYCSLQNILLHVARNTDLVLHLCICVLNHAVSLAQPLHNGSAVRYIIFQKKKKNIISDLDSYICMYHEHGTTCLAYITGSVIVIGQ
jgi:hypothetical protein